MSILLLVLLGCTPTPCEQALQRQESIVAQCGGVLERDRQPWMECSTGDERLLRCEARCMEEADCDTLVSGQVAVPDGGLRGWRDYEACMLGCPTPWQ